MRILLFRCLVYLCFVAMEGTASGQKHVVYPTVPPRPHTPQEILLLFSGNTADERILLTLNNNRPAVMKTSITVFTASGVSTPLPDVELVPQESKMIELSPLLKAAGLGHQELGWIKLDYSGITLELGAQLTLYPTPNGPGVDSPRSLSSDFKSTERDAVFWMPEDGNAHLALTNGSTASIFVKMKCGPLTEEFVIPSKTTKVRHVELHDGPIVQVGRVPISCEIVSDGPVDALRPVGTVIASGYSAPIRFYDPQTATFSSLTAVGLETTAETHVTVHNITDKPVEFTPIVREAALSNPYTRNLVPRKLAPHDSAEVEIGDLLKSFQNRGISQITLTLKTEAAKGAFVGAVTQISSPDRLVEDIPLRTSNPPAFARGSNPLRWDEDYTNLVTVTNTAEEPLRIGGHITAGGMAYALTRTDIEPGATIVFDVDKWKRDGIPDVNGKTIPKDAQYGKIHWIEMSNGRKAGLLGRTSLSSVKNRRKSSFSCGSTCDYHSRQWPFYDPQIFTSLLTGGQQIGNITEYDAPGNGGSYTYPISYNPSNIWVSNSSIASTDADPNSSTNIVVSGNSPGVTDMSYLFYDEEDWYDPGEQVCTGTVSSSEPTGQTTVQEPTSLQVLSVTTLPTGTTGDYGCRPGYDYGIAVDIKYQVLDQFQVPIRSSNMTPYETGSFSDGTSYSQNVGPSRISTTSTTTASDGTFHDAPVQLCYIAPFEVGRTTQNISIIVSGIPHPVRSQIFAFSSSGVTHGAITNAYDINKSR